MSSMPAPRASCWRGDSDVTSTFTQVRASGSYSVPGLLTTVTSREMMTTMPIMMLPPGCRASRDMPVINVVGHSGVMGDLRRRA